jgi:RNA polymerase sigma factor (sigma-70 family)
MTTAQPSLSAQALYTADLQQLSDLLPEELDRLLPVLIAGGERAEYARYRIVEGMQRRIWRMAQRFARRCVHLTALDLAQEATLGLLQALPAIQPQANAEAFFSWATTRMRSRMIAAYWRDEVAFGLSKRQVNRLRATRAQTRADTSSTTPYGTPETCSLEQWTEQHIEDASPSDEPQGASISVVSLFSQSDPEEYQDLYDAIDDLPALERQIVLQLYGLRGHTETSTQQVGRQLRLTPLRVQALEQLAYTHLRAALTRPTNGVA